MSTVLSIKDSKKSTARRPSLNRAVRPEHLATSLPFASCEQADLIHARIILGVCLECGKARTEPEFCAKCIEKSQARIEVARPLYGWSYIVRQTEPNLPEVGAFQGERVGVFENRGGYDVICWSVDTFEDAKALVLKKYSRALASMNWS